MSATSLTANHLADRDTWLAARREAIGASDAPIILGLSKWKSPLALYCDKLGLADPDPYEMESLEWGKALEGPIAERYVWETGRTLVNPGDYTIHQSADWPFMAATLDREIDGATLLEDDAHAGDGPGVLEIKTASYWRREEWADEPPLWYSVQVQHQLAVTGYRWGSLAVLIGGNKFLWMDVERNDAFIEALVEREREFWQRVEQHDPPPADAAVSTREALKRLYPSEVGGKVVTLPLDIEGWDEVRVSAAASLKTIEAQKREAENKIIAALGDAEVGILPGGARYTYKRQQRKGYTVEPCEYRTLRRLRRTEP